jgi:uracil-DNA glycosylase
MYNFWEQTVPTLIRGDHKQLCNIAYTSAPKVFPLKKNVFNALRFCSFNTIRVVIIGQDPYFNEHPQLGPEAHGLCFSVQDGIPSPPSLKNIFKEITNDIYNGQPQSFSTNLTRWATQGVLLLNASLTVIAGQPGSHSAIGWQPLTDNIIQTVSMLHHNVVFLLWGNFAKKKKYFIDSEKHLILTTTHPSPFSAHQGFLGCRHFSLCNQYLIKHNKKPIMW